MIIVKIQIDKTKNEQIYFKSFLIIVNYIVKLQ